MLCGIGSVDTVLSHGKINEIISRGFDYFQKQPQLMLSTLRPEVCGKINFCRLNPNTVNPENYRDREDESILGVEKAGAILYPLKP